MKFKHEARIIRIIRDVYKWTQVDMAKKMGLHCQFISNAERGISQIPLKRLKMLKLPAHHLQEILDAQKKDLEEQFYRGVG